MTDDRGHRSPGPEYRVRRSAAAMMRSPRRGERERLLLELDPVAVEQIAGDRRDRGRRLVPVDDRARLAQLRLLELVLPGQHVEVGRLAEAEPRLLRDDVLLGQLDRLA